ATPSPSWPPPTSTTAASACARCRRRSARLRRQLDTAGGRLAAQHPVLVDAVLAHLVQPRRVDVDRHRGLAHRMADAVDVAGASAPGVARPQLELDLRRAQSEPVLPDAAADARDADAGDVVVVEPGALTRHPRQHPGIHAI